MNGRGLSLLGATVLVGGGLLLIAGGSGVGLPVEAGPASAGAAGPMSESEAGSGLRATLASELDRSRRATRRLEAAVAALDAGGDAARIESDVVDLLGDAAASAVVTRDRCDDITPEEQRIMDTVLETAAPGLRSEMVQVCTQDAAGCDEGYRRLREDLSGLISEAQGNEAMFQLRIEEIKTSKAVYQTSVAAARLELDPASDDAEISRLRGELYELLDRQFDQRMGARRYELLGLQSNLEELSRRVDALERHIGGQAVSRDDVVSRQVDLAMERARERVATRP